MAGFKFSFTDIFFIVSALLILMVSGFSVFASACEEKPDEVLRLHILANSDSEEDQKLKYELRDHMLSSFSQVFAGCENKEQAIAVAKKNRILMEQKANSFIKEKGYSYTVTCEIAETYFTTRKYENYTLPAGNYTAVRFLIGEGKGRNWWCVMFPPLCIPASAEFFTEEESQKIEQSKDIEVKFALFEIFSGLFGGNAEEEKREEKEVPDTPDSVREIFANKSLDRFSVWNLRFLF